MRTFVAAKIHGIHVTDKALHYSGSQTIFEMTGSIAGRVRMIGDRTITSIGPIARLQRIADDDAECTEPQNMLAELCEDNKNLAARLREAHNVCDEHRDIATASLLEVRIDETERRTRFPFEASNPK